ncbi:hypothetical protein D3C87_102910 [compost metagenome]
MKKANFSKLLVVSVLLAAAPYAKAQSLGSSEIESVRGVLRALNINESQLSNEDIEALRNQGNVIRSYDESKGDLIQKIQGGEVYLTCGAGSHGGDRDPV